MTSLKINGIDYDLNDGFIINKKYNEELDSATITIPFSDKLNLSPFDFVEITDERFGTLYFLVDTWVETTVSFNPLKYNYDINLISETIKLQKIVLPNIAITQPIGKNPKSIFQKFQEYYTTYIYPQYNELELGDDLLELMQEDCPETEFNRPTIFEVFNTLLGKVNSVVKIENHKIGIIHLDQYRNEIDESKLYYNNDTQTLKDYADRLDVQVSNGVSESVSFSSLTGITVRGGENQTVVNDDNMILMLEKAIYDIGEKERIFVYLPYKETIGNEEIKNIAKLEITEHIVEKTIYDTYKVSTSSGMVVGNYKRNALYYTRGGNTIEGLAYNETTILGFNTWSALYNIIRVEIDKQISENALPDFTEAEMKDNVYFKVEYKTNESFRFNVEKENNYNVTLIDNQTEQQVDVFNFGKVEQDKLNRLGNKNQIITATYMYDESIPQLGDYIGKYALAQTEIVYYKDYALFKGYLYKDYIRKNMFYGLNSKKRSTQISMESVVRNEIFNIDVTFQLERHSFDGLIRYILMPLSVSGYPYPEDFESYDYYEYPKYCVFSPYDDNYDSILDYRILTTTSSFICGKSNVIQFQMLDNFSAGIRKTDAITGGRKQEYVQYTDDYGEFAGFNASIYSNKRKEFVDNATTKEELTSYRNLLNDLPMLKDENTSKISAYPLFGIGKYLYKDNRETLAVSININYKDSENVIVGNFAKYTGIGYRYNIAYRNIGIMYSTNYEYEVGDEYGVGILDENLALKWADGMKWIVDEVNSLDNLSLNVENINVSDWKSWAIVEKDTGRLILGINKGKQTTIPTTIYLKSQKKSY